MTEIQPVTIKASELSTPPKHQPIQNPLALYLASISPRSRTTMTERLNAVAKAMGTEPEQIDWGSLRDYHVEWIRETLLERGVAITTVNVTISALKGIAKRARNLNLMTSEEYDRIRDVKGARGSRSPLADRRPPESSLRWWLPARETEAPPEPATPRSSRRYI